MIFKKTILKVIIPRQSLSSCRTFHTYLSQLYDEIMKKLNLPNIYKNEKIQEFKRE